MQTVNSKQIIETYIHTLNICVIKVAIYNYFLYLIYSVFISFVCERPRKVNLRIAKKNLLYTSFINDMW